MEHVFIVIKTVTLDGQIIDKEMVSSAYRTQKDACKKLHEVFSELSKSSSDTTVKSKMLSSWLDDGNLDCARIEVEEGNNQGYHKNKTIYLHTHELPLN